MVIAFTFPGQNFESISYIFVRATSHSSVSGIRRLLTLKLVLCSLDKNFVTTS
jgi:hypothetical protein